LRGNKLKQADATLDRKQTISPLRDILFAILESLKRFWPSIGSKSAVETKWENVVAWGGIEPPTQGFSILCSTD